MAQAHLAGPELPDFITLLAEKFPHNPVIHHLYSWANIIYSLLIILFLTLVAYFATRKLSFIPLRLQNAVEAIVEILDDFVCGILGPGGRKYTPFIGTLFIYIICMNLFGIVPFMKSSTASWSTTLGLAICVFIYVQYTAIKELGLLGYLDHLMGKPRGVLAFSVFIPILMFFMHIISELVRPISLSLRLRGNIMGDDLLLAVLSGLGIKGIPLLFFSTLLAIIASIVQALVFSLLTTIYLALVLTDEKEKA
jgi:F-type H+-transporting ATPase subunit a